MGDFDAPPATMALSPQSSAEMHTDDVDDNEDDVDEKTPAVKRCAILGARTAVLAASCFQTFRHFGARWDACRYHGFYWRGDWLPIAAEPEMWLL
jgi:hypothetical protein